MPERWPAAELWCLIPVRSSVPGEDLAAIAEGPPVILRVGGPRDKSKGLNRPEFSGADKAYFFVSGVATSTMPIFWASRCFALEGADLGAEVGVGSGLG